MVTFLKVTYNVTVTMGHVPGVMNVYADAASRQFKLPNGQGPAIRAEMQKRPRIPWPTGCYLPKEDAVHRMHRQAAQEDDVLYVDACTEHGNGMGFLLTDVGWNSFSPSEHLQHVGNDGEIADADINLVELVTAAIVLVAIVALCA